MKAVLFTDGASFGNPGPSGIGAVLKAGGHTVELSEPLGVTTNNVAEYTALIRGLEEARRLGASEVAVSMDSELIVRQINGQYRVKHPHLKPLYERAMLLLRECRAFSIVHIPREANSHADRLSKAAAEASAKTSPEHKKR